MTEHILVVAEEDDRRPFIVECPGVTDDCRSWLECRDDACDQDELDRLDDEGDDEPILHGQRHKRIDGWMVPTEECFMATHPDLADAASDLFGREGSPAGRYPVGFDYDPYGDASELRLKLLTGATS